MTGNGNGDPDETREQHGDERGEFRSGPVAGTALLRGATFALRPVLYAELDGLAVFEGDIVLGTVDQVQRQSGVGVPEALAISGQQFRWPNGVVPFEVDAGLPNRQRVDDAIAHWHANTAIRFVDRTAANAAQHPDFVRFVPGAGCSSMVGRRGGRQDITLGPSCATGNTIHEIGHAIGLWHEQSREDRDNAVTIVWANIDPSRQHNFAQHVTDGDDIGPYDFGSIMHYPANAFSMNGQDTIVPRQPLPAGVVMGQRNGLSAGDIAAVNQLHPPVTLKEVQKDPFFDGTVKEVGKDPIRDTAKELAKDPVTDTTLKEVGKDPIRDTAKEITKDPIHDPTVKEVGKDPAFEPTVKEAGRDPFERPGPGMLGQLPGAEAPFVLATGHQFPGLPGHDVTAQLTEQAQQLGVVLATLDQLRQQVVVLYEQALAQLGRGGTT